MKFVSLFAGVGGFDLGLELAGQADTHRYKQMGNAVTVNVAHYIGVMLTHV